MKKYQLEVKFSYLINTEDMERVLEKMEFPSFDLDDNSHEFLDSSYSWEEVEGECDTCGASYDPGSQLDHCANCGNCWAHCAEKVGV